MVGQDARRFLVRPGADGVRGSWVLPRCVRHLGCRQRPGLRFDPPLQRFPTGYQHAADVNGLELRAVAAAVDPTLYTLVSDTFAQTPGLQIGRHVSHREQLLGAYVNHCGVAPMLVARVSNRARSGNPVTVAVPSLSMCTSQEPAVASAEHSE